jgi:hypothetical protein
MQNMPFRTRLGSIIHHPYIFVPFWDPEEGGKTFHRSFYDATLLSIVIQFCIYFGAVEPILFIYLRTMEPWKHSNEGYHLGLPFDAFQASARRISVSLPTTPTSLLPSLSKCIQLLPERPPQPPYYHIKPAYTNPQESQMT